MAEPRVILVDDHSIVRSGVRRFLESHGMHVVAEAGDHTEGLEAIRATPADVAVLDIVLPGGSGLELIRRVHAQKPALALVAFSMVEDPTYAARVLEAGALAYVCKSSPPDLLVQAVRAASRGERATSPSPGQQRTGESRNPLEALTRRELDVLRMLAQGSEPEEIARTLGVSPKTIANCQSEIKEKLGLRSTVALVHLAIAHGLITLPPST